MAWTTNLRREDAAELMRALNALLDGVAVLAEARVGDGESLLAQGVPQRRDVVPVLLRNGQDHRRLRRDDAVGVEHHVAVPAGGNEDGVLRAKIGRAHV